MYCAHCGAQLKGNSKFCHHCGRRLPQAGGVQLPPVTAPPVDPRAPLSASRRRRPILTIALISGGVGAALVVALLTLWLTGRLDQWTSLDLAPSGRWPIADLRASPTTATSLPSYTRVPSPTTERPTTTSLPPLSTPAPIRTSTATSTRLPTPTHTPTVTPTDTPDPTAAPISTALATPTAEALPTDSPEPEPSATPYRPQVIAYVDQVIINTYNWQEALVATEPGDDVYPYPRLDHSRVGPPSPRTYETVVLENECTRLTLLPELGGRIYRWYDKPSGQEMFYVNPVIKPTRWGARGWWLGMGGMEWAFPVEEHGLVEWRPWSYRIQQEAQRVHVLLTSTEERTGLTAEVTVSLEAGDSTIAIAPRISNPTAGEQHFQFWLNGMFALSPTNRPSADLRFTLPGRSVTVHSTGDRDLPEAGEEMGWPVHNGRDMGRYGNWNGWLGFFAWNADYMGAYDPVSEMGVVRTCSADTARGAKVFGPGGLSPDLWTDDGSGYVELWGGLTRTFWDYTSLPAEESVGWTERWYSLNGLGGLSCANDQAALWLSSGSESVHVGALTTRSLEGRLLLWQDGQVIAEWNVVMSPGTPFHADHPVNSDGNWALQLLDDNDRTVIICAGL